MRRSPAGLAARRAQPAACLATKAIAVGDRLVGGRAAVGLHLLVVELRHLQQPADRGVGVDQPAALLDHRDALVEVGEDQAQVVGDQLGGPLGLLQPHDRRVPLSVCSARS